MANSMTGFGRGEAKGQGVHFSVEIKSVNHRYLEIMVKMPRNFNIIEERLRKIIQQNIQRGRVDVYVNVKETEEKKRLIKVDKELALSYDNSLKELAETLNTGYCTDIYRLVSLPEILDVENEETDAEALWPVLEAAMRDALDTLMTMRRDEGERLCSDLLIRSDDLHNMVQQVSARVPQVTMEYREKLKEKLATLIAEAGIDDTRLMMEVALFADRASIEEEIVRLESHIEQLEKALRSSDPIGRKLDFLVQEMNREVNTIGSKANDLVISQIVVEGKCQLEKIREQVQNIE